MKIVMLEDLKVDKNILNTFKNKYDEIGHQLVICDSNLTQETKIKLLSDADIAIIGSQPFTKEMVEASSNLKYLSVGFTGVNHLDESIYNTNIKISNASGYATVATAELTIAMILNVLRNCVILDLKARQQQTMEGYIGNELNSKTVGVIGTGNIGKHVAKILNSFGASLLFYDMNEDEELNELGSYVSLDELLSQSDIITLHCPLNDITKYLIDKSKFDMMKSNAIIINCARGDIINSEDLIDALNNNKISGAGIDVFDIEPPLNTDHILLNNDKITVTPHIAYASKESMVKRINIVFENVDSFLDGNQINIIK